MQHKHFILSAIVTCSLALCALCSCAPDPIYSYLPEYAKPLRFTLDNPETVTLVNQSNVNTVTSCNRGNLVTVFLPVTYTGSRITSATYYWAIKGVDGSIIKEESKEQIAPHKVKVPPMFTFTAPDSLGTYNVHFRAKFEASAQFENGTFYAGYPTSTSYEGGGTISSKLVVR